MNIQTRSRSVLAFAAFALLVAGVPAAVAAVAGQGPDVIGVALPQVHLGQGDDAAESMRQAVISRLRSPGVEPVALVGSTPAEIEADARSKGCDQILYTNVERKHGMGGFLSKLGPLAGVLPGIAGAAGGGGSGGSGMAGMITQVATNAAARASATAAQNQIMGAGQRMPNGQQVDGPQAHGLEDAARASIKRGDSISFDYRFLPVGGGAPAKSETLHAKADVDGQDVLSPLVAQLAQAFNPSAQGGAGAPPSDAGRPEHTGFLHGLFSARGSSANPSVVPNAPAGASAMPDCAQIASMPNAPISLEACQKMAAAQQTYTRAASDPSAARAGDEQMSCEQIKAEMRQQQISAPDKAKATELTAAATKQQGMLSRHIAEQQAAMAQEQVKVDAAVAADQATAMATGGLVRTNTATAAAMAAQNRARVLGERQAAERRPTEQKLIGGVADMGVDAAQQLASNPRLAHLLQLAQARGCRGS
jgi:hypothetical protein